MSSYYSINNPVFSNLLFYGSIVSLKMLGMAILTSLWRQKRQVFANPEDLRALNLKDKKPVFDDESVERSRRNHLNDLENIPVFLLIGLFYVAINPDPQVALWHFRVFVASRFLHTIAYQCALPQPSRGLTFGVGYFTTISMAVQIICALC